MMRYFGRRMIAQHSLRHGREFAKDIRSVGPKQLHIIFDFGYPDPPRLKGSKLEGYNASLAVQIANAYGHSLKHSVPASFAITNATSHPSGVILKEQHNSHLKWDIQNHAYNLEQLIMQGKYDVSKLVYLSPDADNVLEKVNSRSYYVIGCIADRSIVKHMSSTRAKELGIPCYRLPLKENYKNGLQKYALNIDHVAGMLLDMQLPGMTWKKTFKARLPQRYILEPRRAQQRKEASIERSKERAAPKQRRNFPDL